MKIMIGFLLLLLPLLPATLLADTKVLIVITSHGVIGQADDADAQKTGYFLSEVTHPYYVFKNAGFSIDIASPKGGEPPMDPRSHKLSDDDNRRFVETADDWQKMQNSLLLAEINAADYDAIVFAGGHGTMWDFPDNADIQRLTRDIYQNNGVVAAVCHGPAALVNITLDDGSYLVDGRTVSTFTNFEERIVRLYSDMPFLLETVLEERGATIDKALIPFMEQVSVTDKLVTGQNPNSARAMAEAVITLLAAP